MSVRRGLKEIEYRAFSVVGEYPEWEIYLSRVVYWPATFMLHAFGGGLILAVVAAPVALLLLFPSVVIPTLLVTLFSLATFLAVRFGR